MGYTPPPRPRPVLWEVTYIAGPGLAEFTAIVRATSDASARLKVCHNHDINPEDIIEVKLLG